MYFVLILFCRWISAPTLIHKYTWNAILSSCLHTAFSPTENIPHAKHNAKNYNHDYSRFVFIGFYFYYFFFSNWHAVCFKHLDLLKMMKLIEVHQSIGVFFCDVSGRQAGSAIFSNQKSEFFPSFSWVWTFRHLCLLIKSHHFQPGQHHGGIQF